MGGLSSLDSWNNGAEVALGESAGFFHGDSASVSSGPQESEVASSPFFDYCR
jgi:hypothetical protein